MAVTVADIQAKLAAKNFSVSMLETDFDSLVADALADLDRYSPVTAIAAFDTVTNQQDYAIFDPDNETLGGFAANAVLIKEVYWSPGNEWISMNIFSPGWIALSDVLMFASSYLHQPSQMTLVRQKLTEWKKQFGDQGWEVIGEIGEPESLLRLFPVPAQDDTKVFVEFSARNSLLSLATKQLPNLMEWVYYHAADALANKYATTAGIQLLGFADSTQAMRYWQGRAEFYYRNAVEHQGGLHGDVTRG